MTDNRNAIDRFFDAAEDMLDSTIPQGKIGYTLKRSGEDARTMVWHYGLYKIGTACGEPIAQPKDWIPKIPGGYVLFCCKCLRQARLDLENNG